MKVFNTGRAMKQENAMFALLKQFSPCIYAGFRAFEKLCV